MAALFAIPYVGPILGGLFSPLGRIVLILVAFGWWTLYQRNDAAEEARSECQAAHLRRVITEIERQRDAAQDALERAERQAEIDAKEMAELESERDDLVANAKTGPCDINDSDLGRLRNIR